MTWRCEKSIRVSQFNGSGINISLSFYRKNINPLMTTANIQNTPAPAQNDLDGHHLIDLEESPYDIGEVSYHLGWTFHRAGANQSAHPRRVMTVINFDEAMRLGEPTNSNQVSDKETWCKGAGVGELLTGPLNPVLWSKGC